jgi:hypothetical protein
MHGISTTVRMDFAAATAAQKGGRAMPESSRIRYWTLTSYGSNQKDKTRFSQQPRKAATSSSERTQPIREPVTSIEEAMDIAMGEEGEAWERRRRA